MPQKKLFAALLVAASALLMLGMSNENQIPYPSNYDTKSAGASSYNGLANVPKSPYFQQLDFYNSSLLIRLWLLPKSVPTSKLPNIPPARRCIDGGRTFSGTQRGR